MLVEHTAEIAAHPGPAGVNKGEAVLALVGSICLLFDALWDEIVNEHGFVAQATVGWDRNWIDYQLKHYYGRPTRAVRFDGKNGNGVHDLYFSCEHGLSV
jgi:hypothetical protein